MKINTLLSILLFVTAFVFTSCDKDDEGANVVNLCAIIKFESANGTNLADSLRLCKEEFVNDLLRGNDKNAVVDFVRERDGKSLFNPWSCASWMRLGKQSDSEIGDFPILEIDTFETVLCVASVDDQLTQYGIKQHDEVYKVNVQCEPLFKDTEVHTLAIHVRVYRRHEWTITNCYFDGKDVTSPGVFGNFRKDGSQASRVAFKIVL